MKTVLTVAASIILFSASGTFAEDWPHWRGPSADGMLTGNGVAPDSNPPTSWSEKENVRWKTQIPGSGSSSPIVMGDRVFVSTAIPTGKTSGRMPELDFVTLAVDRKNGKILWNKVAVRATPHQGTHSTNGFASASPCTDGQMVYSHFGSRGLYAYSLDGNLAWKRDDLGRMQTRSDFGEGSSPTIAGDKILVPWDHEGQSYLYCLNKNTGETVWKATRDEPSCWATPVVIKHDGMHQVIMNGQTKARSYDLGTGSELWSCAGQTQRPVATPVATENLAFVGSGFRGAFLAAFDPSGTGDIEGSKYVKWSVGYDTPDIASFLLSGNRLYYHKAKTGMLSCVDATTGKAHFQTQRVPDIRTTYASPVAAGGHVYVTGRSGTVAVIDDSTSFKVISTNSLGEGIDATPAIAGDQIFIRGTNSLFCIGQ